MFWLSESELDDEGPPSRREVVWAILGIPLMLLLVCGWGLRLLAGFRGHPLVVSSLLDIHVLRSESPWYFALGVALYGLFIAFGLLALWACAIELQRWFHWRGRDTRSSRPS